MNPYACPECKGQETMICKCCGSEVDCERCDRTGLDPARIDTSRWKGAYHDFLLLRGHSWEWIEEGAIKGATNDRGERLAYADFLLPELS